VLVKMLDPLTRGATYVRALHVLIGAAVGPVCVMVSPGFSESLPRTLAASAVVPVPLLLLLGMVPSVRHAEGVQARLMLFPADERKIGLAPAKDLAARCRTGVWLVARTWWGLLVASTVVQLLSAAGTLVALPASGRTREILGAAIQGGREQVWVLAFVPVLLLLAAGTLVGAGHVQLAVAERLLGPSTAERLADAERRADELLARNRLAGELHDSIGHALTATVVQAGAARELIDADRDFVLRALTAIEETGRRAMDDLERALGHLKDVERPAARRTRPTLADIGQLLEASRASGTVVRAPAADAHDFTAIPDVISREAYRILQEALTNAMKHAPGSPVDVALDLTDDRMEISVANPIAAGTRRVRGSGKGVRSMCERAALLGGGVTAGPDSGRWVVSARLPLRLRS
jgi:signal transduction histidine kinase